MKIDILKNRFQELIFLCFLIFLSGCASVPSWQADKDTSNSSPKGVILLKVIGEGELGSNAFNQPQGVVIDPAGNLYIVDSGNNRIVKCSLEGDFLKEVGGFGWGNGEFNLPSFITIDNGLSLYVTDTQNKRVQRLDNYLNFIQSISPQNQEKPFENSQLKGVALSRSGELFLADAENDCIIKLDNQFAFQQKFGGFESGYGALNDPQGISIDARGNLYVADSGNDRIAVYDSFGNFLKELGRGYLNRPYGVEVSSRGIVYVANTFGDNLVALDENGKLLFEFGKNGRGEGEFSRPKDLKIYESKKICISDSGNNRIQVLELVE
jgi:tripartite motif-containing protein 71